MVIARFRFRFSSSVPSSPLTAFWLSGFHLDDDDPVRNITYITIYLYLRRFILWREEAAVVVITAGTVANTIAGTIGAIGI
jgi:hypothetical protein